MNNGHLNVIKQITESATGFVFFFWLYYVLTKTALRQSKIQKCNRRGSHSHRKTQGAEIIDMLRQNNGALYFTVREDEG